jgi:carboxylesterase type B
MREATVIGPPAMQAANAVSSGLNLVAASREACLAFDVWTPVVADGRRLVLVWLLGGAFVTGAG